MAPLMALDSFQGEQNYKTKELSSAEDIKKVEEILYGLVTLTEIRELNMSLEFGEERKLSESGVSRVHVEGFSMLIRDTQVNGSAPDELAREGWKMKGGGWRMERGRGSRSARVAATLRAKKMRFFYERASRTSPTAFLENEFEISSCRPTYFLLSRSYVLALIGALS
ncbi:hypothetical protein KQX54_005284 [Cotesia glomerata]|uniref:Uncharacterized protein n=1 Tax=Cotesia glomerata TaxID=32391 RepID=A0AAV7I3T0_COTGL|nr:hypothetical protein KQX54_005284 [Cotesia glomerata]